MIYELTCLDCGAHHRVKRMTAKYCPKCALRRNLMYVEGGRHKMRVKRDCTMCSQPFRLTHVNDYKWCGECRTSMDPHTELLKQPDCVYCKRKVSKHSALVNVCLGCQSAPDMRKQLLKGLAKGQATRREVNATALQAIADGGSHLRALYGRGGVR